MIVGMTVLKNATLMGYPWVESILSVLDYVDIFYVGEGCSQDNTWSVLERLASKHGKIILDRYEWPVMRTGFAIGDATNHALEFVRRIGENAKILYVQADELWRPESLEEMVRLADEPYDAYEIPYLHLEHNCQEIQQGAGYQRAIRMVQNKPTIRSHRDAWTFEGYTRMLSVHSLPFSLVHCNYCFWDNVPIKKKVQAIEFYPDLGHYAASAEEAQRLHDAYGGVMEKFTATTSPYQDYLPEVFWPMLGQRRYYVRDELLE